MAYQHNQSHARNSGTARGIRLRDYSDSRSATRVTNESSTRRQSTAPGENSPRRRRFIVGDRPPHRSSHQGDAETDSDSENDPCYRFDQHRSHSQQQQLSYDIVPRSWQSRNPEVHRVLRNPALQDAITTLEGRNQPHNRTFARQLRPTPTHDHRPRALSPDWYQRTSRPLGMSNLRNLDHNRGQFHAMENRFREDQRVGPYDAIGYVERREQYAYERGYGQHQQYEGYEEFDDRSSNTFY